MDLLDSLDCIAWLKERVTEMHRLLKPTGAFFLHCDWHANAPIKYMILDKLFSENNFKNRLVFPKTMEGRIQRKKYLDEDKGVLIGDLWADIQNVQPFSAEKIGYPTQKPQKLLERIIEMTTF